MIRVLSAASALFFIAITALSACSAAPSASSEPSRVEPVTPATASVEPMAAASSLPTEIAAPAEADEPKSTPKPQTPEEQKAMEKRCKPLIDSLNRAARKAPGEGGLAALERALEKPPAMPAGDLEVCTTLLEQSLRAREAATHEVEARQILQRIAISMASAYEANGKLCPPTERPIPASFADVDGKPYRATKADWNAPTWKCLNLEIEGQTLRFQYEVKTDPKAQSFEVIARGAFDGGNKPVEIVQRGAVRPSKGMEISPPERRGAGTRR